jgi:hypothetical protein
MVESITPAVSRFPQSNTPLQFALSLDLCVPLGKPYFAFNVKKKIVNLQVHRESIKWKGSGWFSNAPFSRFKLPFDRI